MKALIISLILFILILALIIMQSCAVQKLTRGMLLLIDALPAQTGGGSKIIEELTVTWEAHKLLLSLTVSHKILDEIDYALTDLQISDETGDEFAYRRALPHLQNAVEKLRDAEGFSLQSLI